jgi:hypothetical protein
MRKGLTILLVGWLLFGSSKLMAQTPLGINYQGIARSADGSPLINQFIGLRVSITNGPDGSVDFIEEHHPETNAFGLFAVILGQGQSAGRIAEVDWGAGNKWLQIEIDPQDNGNYLLVGTQQMLSVPYALYAANSGKPLTPGFGVEINNNQISNTLPDRIVNINGTGAATVSGSYPNFTVDVAANSIDADADPTNELQTVSKAGSTVTLSNGGGSFTDAVDDADSNPTNELQTVTKSGNTVTLSNSGGSFTDAVDDADADATNEIQSLTKTGDVVNLSSGGSVNLAGYLDNTDNQNLTSTSASTNRTINISGGTSTTISVADNDNSASNELQTVSKAANVVTLSNGGGSFIDAVNDADSSPTNEVITNGSYVSNNTLRLIEAGNITNIPLGTLNANLNVNSNRLTNLAAPVSPGDALNLSYFEAKVAADYAMSIPLSYTSLVAGDVPLDLSAAALDKGGLISGPTITISEPGVYAVSIQGISGLTTGSDIVITVDGVPTPVIRGLNHYMGQYLFDLVAGNQIQIVVKFGASPESVTLQISAYKI